MPTACLNCSQPVERNFCAACGQRTGETRGPLFGLLGDFFSEFLSIDGRHLRTAVRLALPGRLTQLYLEGKRASYVPPVRVYFVASLLFFLLVGLPSLDAEKTNVYVDDVLIGRDEPDPAAMNFQLIEFDDSARSEQIQAKIFSNVEDLYAMEPQALLDAFFAGLERTIPVALICFLPILAFGLKLLYIRRPFFYVDHLVFAIHFQSFMFVMIIGVRLANSAGLGHLSPPLLNYVLALFLLSPIYLFFALRRVYEQGWIKTAFKAILLSLAYLVLAQPVMLVTFAIIVRGI